MPSDGGNRGWRAGWRTVDEEETPAERIFEVRLDRMRRELRIYRALFGLIGLALLGGGVWWMLKPPDAPANVLRAHRIEVVSPEGRATVTLDADRIGGRISLRYNRGGTPAPPGIFLAADQSGGAIQIYEPGQNYYALAMEVGAGGEGLLKVRARGKREGLLLRGPADEQAGGELEVFNADGKPAVRLGTREDGRGFVSAQPAAR